MTITERNTEKKLSLIRSAVDPVLLYTVVVMMSIMYHYRSQLAVLYGIVTLVIGWLVFRLFDFAQKRKLLGALGIGIVYLLFLLLSGMAIEKGSEKYPISWSVWFLTPQDTINAGVGLGYNKWYTLAIYLLFLIFMLSVIYYFTQVRYRIFMNFMIFIIPFAIYGKEYEKMPIGYIMLLAVGYVLLMVYFRRLHNNSETVVVDQGEAWRSVAVYAVIFALVSTLFPKPVVEEDRTYLENLINAEAIVKKLENIIDAFRDTADGSQFRQQTGNLLVYSGDADESLRLKLETFSSYNFDKDEWSTRNGDKDIAADDIGSDMPYEMGGCGDIAEAVIMAASLDSGYSSRYGLDGLKNRSLEYPESDVFTINILGRGGNGIPVPQYAQSFSEGTNLKSIYATASGTLRAAKSLMFETYKFTYLPETSLYTQNNKEIIDMFSRDDYSDLTYDAGEVLNDYLAAHEKELSEEESARIRRLSDAAYDAGPDYDDSYMKAYGADKDIEDLAKALTAGCSTDLDKALAFEMYFYNSGYIYDLDYVKQPGENVDSFLFETKTGVCVEYATAMTLLARSVGIPARYCEGFNMSQRNTDKNAKSRFIITTNDAHAFPELYIRGFGWVSFEPTRTDQLDRPQRVSTTNMLSRLGVILLITAVLALLFIFVSPVLMHRFFLIRAGRRSPNDTVRAVMERICRLYGIKNVNTSHQAEEYVKNYSGADISGAAVSFDRAVYGEATLSENEKKQAINEYIAAYEALKEKKKSRKRVR